MILVDSEILQAIESGDIVIDPFDPSLINSQSLDFRLGRTFSLMGMLDEAVDPTDPESFEFKPIESDFVILNPGQFIIATSLERLELAPNICAKIHGKSSLGRCGIDQSSIAGWVDGGFHGPVTLEIANSGPFPIKLTAGMKIGQYVFHRTNMPNKHYGIIGRYNNQNPAEGSKGI